MTADRPGQWVRVMTAAKLPDELELLANQITERANRSQQPELVDRNVLPLVAHAAALILDVSRQADWPNAKVKPPFTSLLKSIREARSAFDIDDDVLVTYWRTHTMPWLRFHRPQSFAPGRDSFDFPEMTPESERLLQKVRKIKTKSRMYLDPKGLAKVHAAMSVHPDRGPIGKYTAIEALDHARARADGWAESVRAAAALVRDDLAAATPPNRTGKPTSKKGHRRLIGDGDADEKLLLRWEKRNKSVDGKSFAKNEEITHRQLTTRLKRARSRRAYTPAE